MKRYSLPLLCLLAAGVLLAQPPHRWKREPLRLVDLVTGMGVQGPGDEKNRLVQADGFFGFTLPRVAEDAVVVVE